jgi:hypothetical protein
MLSSYQQRRVRRYLQWCPLIVGGRCLWIHMKHMSASYDFGAARRSYCKAHLSAQCKAHPPKEGVLLNLLTAGVKCKKSHLGKRMGPQAAEIVVERAVPALAAVTLCITLALMPNVAQTDRVCSSPRDTLERAIRSAAEGRKNPTSWPAPPPSGRGNYLSPAGMSETAASFRPFFVFLATLERVL